MKIILATAPGIDSNGNYIIYSPSRWCEGIRDKTRWFAYYPWELGYLSSFLKSETEHKVKLIDGCLEKLDKYRYYNRILNEKPDYLLFESSTRTIDESLWIAKKVKNKLGTKLIFAGQHPSVFPEELINEGVDYVCVGEYEISILELMHGKNPSGILGLYPNKRRSLLDINRLPFPEDKDVKRIDYSYPGEPCSEYREIEVFASRGCPFNCNFCVARNVYYNISNWRPRKVKDIIDEIRYLKDKYHKMEGVFFNEEVHNGRKKFILDLTEEIINNKLDYFNYEAMCDIRLLDKEMIHSMSQAGYYKVRVGIESASRGVLNSIGKSIDLEELKEKLFLCKKDNIKTYGTFMFGALGSTPAKDKKSANFIRKLIKKDLLDNVQISICTPQPGTPFCDFVKKKGYLNSKAFFEFDGGLNSIVNYPNYSGKEILNSRDIALVIRNREVFKQRVNFVKLLEWVRSTISKYGYITVVLKVFKRISLELKFSLRKIGIL